VVVRRATRSQASSIRNSLAYFFFAAISPARRESRLLGRFSAPAPAPIRVRGFGGMPIANVRERCLARMSFGYRKLHMKFVLLGCAMVVAVGCNDPTTRSSTSGIGAGGTVNTAVNVRDRNDATKTPIDQNENARDIGLTADIRKRVVALDASVNAHNVKIITQDGRVTLRGPVKTADEKRRIEEIAFEVAGKANVDSQLEVEAAK